MSAIDKIFEKYNESHPDGYHAASFTAVDKTGREYVRYPYDIDLLVDLFFSIGKVLHSSHYGNLKVDGSGPPVTEDSIFWTASMTKIFTAVAAMIVVERGLISLDDDAGKVVSELAEPDILVGFEEGSVGKTE